MSSLDLFQQIYLQTFSVNLAGTIIGPEAFLQKAIQVQTNLMVKKFLGQYGWEITWGPRVWKSDNASVASGLTNCWMVMKAPNIAYPDGNKFDTYVVSIAGTAVFSPEDWQGEDFGVDKVVGFEEYTGTFNKSTILEPQGIQNPSDTTPYCAWGTTYGAWAIASNVSPDGYPAAGTTIINYLKGLQKSPGEFRVIFTGHSLGCALSPYLSLAVKTNDLVPSIGNPLKDILTLPAAGASPGDKLFSDLYNKENPASGPGGYQMWNADFYNTLDIVPQAWSTDDSQDRNLDKIVSIYGPLEGSFLEQVEGLVQKAKDKASASGLTYIPITGNAFTYDAPDSPPGNLATFLIQAALQHTTAYYKQIKVGPQMAELYQALTSVEGVQKKPARVVAKEFPVLSHADNKQWGDSDDESYPYDCILDGK
ncbi:hypothetical protein CSIM01_09464 [Colletotrichum simmondsii]|uniref:Fungal lipase-type domain-containing protein n=1 Tax=Colletotrichum simmondsii TaxID=703756 RepID=A0A135S7B2_9PEZI|nr:hypothetical protein CSIM01_09464 [Colletotrichum simmondsii]